MSYRDEKTRKEAWQRLSGLRVALGLSLALYGLVAGIVIEVIKWF